MTTRYRNGEVWQVIDQGTVLLDRGVDYRTALMLAVSRARDTQRTVELVAQRVAVTVPFHGAPVLIGQVTFGAKDALLVQATEELPLSEPE